MAILTYRDTIRKISPPWLQHGLAEKILYALGVHIDGFGDALVAGVKLRFPAYYSDESLPLIGRERRIRRGRSESAAVYATRLRRWLIDHQRRGGPYAMLAQLYAHYAPAIFLIELIYRSGRRYSMDVAGDVVRDDTAWTFDTVDAAQWARWLLVYHWPTAIIAPGTWDGDPALWDDPTTVWDSDMTPEDVEDIRTIPKEWNAAHCLGTVQLIDPGGNTIHLSIG